MKKILFLLAMMPLTLCAQQLKAVGTSAEDVLPGQWTCLSACGDMNKDGIKDLAIIAFPPEERPTPLLAIYWGEKGGSYRLWDQYPNLLLASDEFSFYEYGIDITAKGV